MARAIWIAFGLVLTAGLISAGGDIKQKCLNKCPDDIIEFAKEDKSWAKVKYQSDINKVDTCLNDTYFDPEASVQGFSVSNLTQHESNDKFDIGITDISYLLQVPNKNDGYCHFTITVLPRECTVAPLRNFNDPMTNVSIKYVGNAGELLRPAFDGLDYDEDKVFEEQDYFMKECDRGSFNFPSGQSPNEALELWRCSVVDDGDDGDDGGDGDALMEWHHVFGNISCEYCNKAWLLKCSEDQCIPRRFRCDGSADCSNGMDEEDCPSNCEPIEFECSPSECVPQGSRCNGEADCSDGSDEWGCLDSIVVTIEDTGVDVQVPMWLNTETGDYGAACYSELSSLDDVTLDSICQDFGFGIYYTDMERVKKNQLVDKDTFYVWTNTSRTFEEECPTTTKVAGIRCSLCYDTQFECGTGECIPADSQCNRAADCDDYSDEDGCMDYSVVTIEDTGVDVQVPLWLNTETGDFAAACYSELKSLDDVTLNSICQDFGFGVYYTGMEKVKKNQVDVDTFYVWNNTRRTFEEECPTTTKVAGIYCSYSSQVTAEDTGVDVQVPLWLNTETGNYGAACYSELNSLDDVTLTNICQDFGLGVYYIGMEKVKKNQVDYYTQSYTVDVETFYVWNNTGRTFVEEGCPTTRKVAGMRCSSCDPSMEFECGDKSCISLSNRCDFQDNCTDKSDEANCYSFNTDVTKGVLDEETGLNITYSVPLVYNPNEGDYVPICDVDWEGALNNKFCKKAGYEEAISGTGGNIAKKWVDESKNGYAVLEKDENNKISLLEYRSSCDGNKVRTLECAPA